MQAEDSKSVVVTTFDHGAGLQLDVTSLYKILCSPELVDTPLAVIGIAGCLRTGKSFLTTFLIRYLRNKGWKNPRWIGDDDTIADDGVQWRGGRHAHTQGIVIWNEIFTVEKDNGEKVTVLLLDTQGLFDQSMEKRDNMKLFTMTVLLSSLLMLNLKSQIDERELEYLQLFVEYAKATENDGKRRLFQDLVFLIRDWQHAQDNAYGLDGGKSYLDEILSPHPNSEMNDVRRDLRESFQSLQCFLMPHPGLAVTNSDFKGENKDIEPEFLNQIKDLATAILHPDNVRAKTHNGKIMTGHSLWQLLSDCDEMFRGGEMPSVDSMATAMSKNVNNAACDESLCAYEEAMREDGGATTMERDKVVERHSKALASALSHFDKTTFGREHHRADYRQRLIEKCQHRFTSFTELSKLQQKQAHNFSVQKVHELWTDYRDKIREDIGDMFRGPEELRAMHETHRDDVIRTYEKEAGEHLGFLPDHLETLKRDISAAFEKFKKINDEKEYLETLRQQGESCQNEYEGYKVLHELSQEYRREMEKFAAMYVEKLEEQLYAIKVTFVEKFEDAWSRTLPNIQIFRKTFMDTLEEGRKAAVEINERNKSVFASLIEERIMELKEQYRKAMEEVTRDTYMKPEDLDVGHTKVTEKLLQEFTHEIAEYGEKVREDHLGIVKKELGVEYEEIKKDNQSNKTAKPSLDPKYLFDRISATVTVISLTVAKYKNLANRVKSTYQKVQYVVPKVASGAKSGARIVAAGAAPSSLPVAAAIGVAAVVGVTVVAAYCVYKNKKKKQLVEEQKKND